MLKLLKPLKTKAELQKAIRETSIEEFEVFELSGRLQEKLITNSIRKMNPKSGSISVIVMRSK